MASCGSSRHTVGTSNLSEDRGIGSQDCVEEELCLQFSLHSCCWGRVGRGGGGRGPFSCLVLGQVWAGSRRVSHLPLGYGLQPRTTSHPQRCGPKQNSRERPGELWGSRSPRKLCTCLHRAPQPGTWCGPRAYPTHPRACQVPPPLLSAVHIPPSALGGLPALPGHIQTQPLSSESKELAGPAPAQLPGLPKG